MQTIIRNTKMLGNAEFVDVAIRHGKIEKIGKDLKGDSSDIVLDGKGQYLFPGFVDLHIHLREPGGEQKETIHSGTLAAARGGFTTVCAMPNTSPVPYNIENYKAVMNRVEESANVRVYPYAAITKDLKGEELASLEALKDLGSVAFTDDGIGVQSADMMYQAMKIASKLRVPVVAHCEENTLLYGGVMHDGKRNKQLNLPGIPSISESVHIARDVLLAEAADCHYHVCHVSTKESVRVIRDAKRAGIRVTAEVTPHHLLLTENDIPNDDANYKMNPPLRSEEDREALIEGLLDGTIDCIATDHAPHTPLEKASGFMRAPFGIVGLETAFPLLYTHFVQRNIFTLSQLVDWLTIKPAKVFQLPFGELKVGAYADLVLVDLEQVETIDASQFLSKGKNTPFDGYEVYGIPTLTMVNGEIVWQKENVYA